MVEPSSISASNFLAALPMYDFAHLQKHNDALWSAVAARLRKTGLPNVPSNLCRSDMPLPALWQSPDLILAQTCGYPLMKDLFGKVQLVATPKYSASGCREAYYRSAIIVRLSEQAQVLQDLKGRRCAVNDWSSNSGMNLLREQFAPFSYHSRLFSSVITTGSHLKSLTAVVENLADVAAIDCVTLEHLKLHAPELVRSIKVIGWTNESPGLPLITSKLTTADTVEKIRAALLAVSIDEELADTRKALLLTGFEMLSIEDYQIVVEIEQGSVALGYPHLA